MGRDRFRQHIPDSLSRPVDSCAAREIFFRCIELYPFFGVRGVPPPADLSLFRGAQQPCRVLFHLRDLGA